MFLIAVLSDEGERVHEYIALPLVLGGFLGIIK